jgi:hypothetical protein
VTVIDTFGTRIGTPVKRTSKFTTVTATLSGAAHIHVAICIRMMDHAAVQVQSNAPDSSQGLFIMQ